MGVFEKLGTGNGVPVGMGFRPTENELINHYLKRKLQGLQEDWLLIPDLDIYQWEPQALFEKYDKMSHRPSDGRECFYFCKRKGTNRLTGTGFWKETRKRHIVKGLDGNPIWSKKILVYYEGRQPKGRKSHYSMHEYHLCSTSKHKTKAPEMELVLCRIINREEKTTSPDSPLSECIDADLVSPGASTTTNHLDNVASPQICVSSSNEKEVADTEGMMEYYESLGDAEPQLQFYNNDQFHADGCSTSTTTTSSAAFDPSVSNLDDIDGMSSQICWVYHKHRMNPIINLYHVVFWCVSYYYYHVM